MKAVLTWVGVGDVSYDPGWILALFSLTEFVHSKYNLPIILELVIHKKETILTYMCPP